MADDLAAVCDHCLMPVADGAGVLEVDTDAADRAMTAWRRKVGADPHAVFHTTPSAKPVRWRVRHHACGGAPKFAYAIAVERIRTWTGLLHWTTHLADKSFTPATDWHDLIDRALDPTRAAVSGLLPVVPRSLRRGPVGDRRTEQD